MRQDDAKIFSYRNGHGRTTFTLSAGAEGIVVSYVSVFDTDSWETDTYVSKPFSPAAMKKAIDDLIADGTCGISERQQTLTIAKQDGMFNFSFDGGDGRNCFGITGIPFDPESARGALRQLDP